MNAIPPHFHLLLRLIAICPKKSGTITMFSGWKWQSLQETHPTQFTVFPLGHNQHSRLKNFTFHTMIDGTEDLYWLPLAFLLASALKLCPLLPTSSKIIGFTREKKNIVIDVIELM